MFGRPTVFWGKKKTGLLAITGPCQCHLGWCQTGSFPPRGGLTFRPATAGKKSKVVKDSAEKDAEATGKAKKARRWWHGIRKRRDSEYNPPRFLQT